MGHFSHSTQDTKKLLDFQKTAVTLPIYSTKGYQPKKLLQDCQTRWWSTYRMLKRLRLCKPALVCLHAGNHISCPMLNDKQWVVLEQIEITLKKMSSWQRILEGDKYPTGSLVVSAIYAIREHYSNIIASSNTQAPVKSLATILLKDFDNRYHPPTDHKGKVRFSRDAGELGVRNRYIGVHPYFFIAAFLDLRTRRALLRMMVPAQYDDLRALILELLVERAMKKEMLGKEGSKELDAAKADDCDSDTEQRISESDYAFEGLYDDEIENRATMDVEETTEESFKIKLEAKLAAYELEPTMKMKDNNGEYNDPLKYWKKNEENSPDLAALAKEFLTIPATSAPSERIWSRAARVITAKRNRIKPEVTSRMIFSQENSDLIREHWSKLKPGLQLPDHYLPSPVQNVDEDGNIIDVGQHDED